MKYLIVSLFRVAEVIWSIGNIDLLHVDTMIAVLDLDILVGVVRVSCL